ncbi:MAG TPA: DEAD/DEAH box helicase [Candidatus Eisenbacteria bacterium]|nr:DEAD/DEAH box helicase [Candidatus Eisenbacteria bacterium]
MNEESASLTFHELGIAPELLGAIDKMNFVTPMPIQAKAIPIAVSGKDVLGLAQTGSGKTLSFGIPMVQLLSKTPGRALILVPTRELAIQVDETLRKLGHPFGIHTVILIGGMSMSTQIQVVKKPTTRVLIATPGRLIDHLEKHTVTLDDMKMVVLDEADRMLDMGFAPQIEKIRRYLKNDRQTLLFSATMPDEILKIAHEYMREYDRVEVDPPGVPPDQIVQELFVVRQEQKRALLLKILVEFEGSVLVFARTKANAKRLTKALRDAGHSAAEIHANRSLGQRREALEGFKSGKYRVLVATDIAARGIDVTGIELVVNYDLPDVPESYVHRIGRTGRAGREGHAITFAAPDQGADVRAIERLLKNTLKVCTHPDLPGETFTQGSSSQPRQGGGRQRGGRGGGRPHGGRPHDGRDRGRQGGGRPSELREAAHEETTVETPAPQEGQPAPQAAGAPLQEGQRRRRRRGGRGRRGRGGNSQQGQDRQGQGGQESPARPPREAQAPPHQAAASHESRPSQSVKPADKPGGRHSRGESRGRGRHDSRHKGPRIDNWDTEQAKEFRELRRDDRW